MQACIEFSDSSIPCLQGISLPCRLLRTYTKALLQLLVNCLLTSHHQQRGQHHCKPQGPLSLGGEYEKYSGVLDMPLLEGYKRQAASADIPWNVCLVAHCSGPRYTETEFMSVCKDPDLQWLRVSAQTWSAKARGILI